MAEQKKKDSGTVRLKLAPASWPVDEFNPSIEGVPNLKFGEYTDVPAGQEQAIRDRAKDSGLTIGKEG
jgi:hypothetical protein